MDRYLRFFLRLCAITFGFFIGTLAAAVAFAFLTRVITPEEAGHITNAGLGIGLVAGFLVAAAIAGYIAFVPAMLVILFAEYTRRRDWLFYTIAGGLVAVIVPLLGHRVIGAGPSDTVNALIMLAVAGMIGGLAYWLFAGARAGNWLPSDGVPPTAPPSAGS